MADTIDPPWEGGPYFVRVVAPVLVGGTLVYYEYDHELPSREQELRRIRANFRNTDLGYPWLREYIRGSKRARVSDDAIIQRGLREARAGDAGMPGECAVCLEDFNADAGETLRVMPSCSHAFHPDCIVSWLRVKPVCPLCRQAMPTQQQQDKAHDFEGEDDEDSDEDDSDTDTSSDDDDDADYQEESTPAVPDQEDSS